MIIRLPATTAGLFLVGALLIHVTHRVKHGGSYQKKRDWIKFAVFMVIVAVFITGAWAGRAYAAAILSTICMLSGFELYRNLNPIKLRYHLLGLFLTGAVSLGLAHLLLPRTEGWFASFVFVYLLVAVADSFGQLFGRLLGKRRLCPRLSPAKTIEGLLMGFLCTIMAAFAFGFLLPAVSSVQLALLGLITAIGAASGDLLFSGIKRRLGIKDFSGLIPGHGGFLDRFDSLIIAAPVFYWTHRAMCG